MNKNCKNMNYYINEGTVKYSNKFDEYSIKTQSKNISQILIYCPWCGKKLPNSRRGEWFNQLINLGFGDPFTDDIPEKYKSGKWYL